MTPAPPIGLLDAARIEARSRAPAIVAADLARAIGDARRAPGHAAVPAETFGFDLSALDPAAAAGIYAALLDETGRRELGAFYTPAWLARRLVRQALAGRRRARVIDPACGGGAFLVEAARRLEARLGDRREAACSVFGLDRDPGAIAVCRAVLEAAGFPIPEENLICTDALAGSWPGAPFDVVAGNPPYRNVVRLPAEERHALKARFETFRNKCDLYGLFVEAAVDHLAPEGRLALLISDSFFGTSSFAPLRRRLFAAADLQVRSVDRVPASAFPGAGVQVVSLIAECRAPEVHRPVRFGAVDDRRGAARVTRQRLLERCETSAALPRDPALVALTDRMVAASVPLGSLADLFLGVKTGDDGRFLRTGPGRPAGDTFLPCVRGRDVQAWQIRDGGWIDYRPDVLRTIHGARPRRPEHFDRPGKILLRETSGRRLIAAFDAKRRLPLDTLHVVLPRPEAGVSIWYLLAVLNAAPTAWWYGLHHPGPHVKAAEVRALPVPPPTAACPAETTRAVADAALYLARAAEPSHPRSGTGRAERYPIPEICLLPGARMPLLTLLSRHLSGADPRGRRSAALTGPPPEGPAEGARRSAAQALVDGIVATAYGLDAATECPWRPEMNSPEGPFSDPVHHAMGKAV